MSDAVNVTVSPVTVQVTVATSVTVPPGGGAVSSVFTRAGNVVAQSGDYAIGQISGAGTAASHAATDFDTAGAASAAQSAAITAAASSAASLYVPLTDLPVSIPNGGTGGITALAARSGLGVYNWDTPAARGLLEYNYPPQMATISNNLVTQSIYGTSIIAQEGGPTTKVGVGVLSSAGTPTSGQNMIGLYSVSGTTATQIAVTGDLGTWGSQGFNSYAWGASQSLTPGATYLILLMSNATTPVHLAGISATAGFPPMYNAGLSNTAAPWFRVFLYGASMTALPSPSFTISASTMASTNAQSPWVCLL